MFVLCAAANAGSPWDPQFTTQANAILMQMTVSEKIAMVHGYDCCKPYVGQTVANTRLGIPPLHLEDGPQGVADGATKVTAFPSALTVAMTWDPDLMHAFGAAMGAEQYLKGSNVVLGPGVNLARVPWGGRTFEYLGEDPHLASVGAAQIVKGIQSQPMGACVKHYVDNTQEHERDSVSEVVPERAQWELYYQPFFAAVDAGVASAMCSYNRINGTYACENGVTLNALKAHAGFRGWVMSDWGATHSTVPAANAGLDQQMPDDSFFGAELATAVGKGQVTHARLDDMVRRMLVPMLALGLFAHPPTPDRNISAPATSPERAALAGSLAEASITLLKNAAGVLPVMPDAVRNVVVFGDTSTVAGGGSGSVIPPYIITPAGGIDAFLNGGPAPSSAPRPAQCTFYPNTDFYQPSNPCFGVASQQECCAACAANPTCAAFAVSNAGGGACSSAPLDCWIKYDTSGRRDAPGVTAGVCPLPPSPPKRINVTYNPTQDPVVAAQAAAAADLAVVVVATNSGEGSDRADLSLPGWMDAMAQAVSLAAPTKSVIVVRAPGAVTMPWLKQANTVLYQLLAGQEAGTALARAIFGAVNPSGRLPVSFPNSMTDTWLGNPVNPQQYPGVQNAGDSYKTAVYTEGMEIGYRWYDARGTAPLFPFGHGLSYTQFTYSAISASGVVSRKSGTTVTVSVTVENSGGYDGSEVVQVYVSHPDAAGCPPKALKRFEKVRLLRGESRALTFSLDADALRIWDATLPGWADFPGTYTVHVAASAADVRGNARFAVTE